MKLLVVEGNPHALWQQRQELGGMPYHRRFIELLRDLGHEDVEVAFPVEGDNLPRHERLQQFDGILLTGSSLNVYDDIAEVTNQLNFAERCFASGVPIYGSCWGLQIAVTLAGGRIAKSRNGREFGIAENITLTEAGQRSPFFANKPAIFDAYCIHEDDTHELPDNTVVLAENAHSAVQAIELYHGQSCFFGVQYHPEFTQNDIAFLADLMHQRLTAEGIFSEQRTQTDYLQQMARHTLLSDRRRHTLEIQNWLKQLGH